jgi:hypothetical protein
MNVLYLIGELWNKDQNIRIIMGLGLWYLNATFNNISVISISWWSVLLVKETGVPRENHQPAASHRQTPHHEQDSNSHDIHLNTLKLHVHTSVVAMLDFTLAITIYNILAFECTWWMLFQKHVVCTKFDIYVFMTEGFIMIFENLLQKNI